MIKTGITIAHSLVVLPKKTASCGAKKSSQKYPTIATNAKESSNAPKDLFLNCFFPKLGLTSTSLKTFEYTVPQEGKK